MDFKDILLRYNIPIAPEGHHHARPGWIQFDCPFCGVGTHKYHAGYNIGFGYVNCWRCGQHALISTIFELTGLSVRECKKLLSDIDIKRVEIEKPKGKLVIPKGVGELLSIHRKYLIRRGYDIEQLIKLWKIQGIGISFKLNWRIFIPIYYHGEVVSWTTRSVSYSPFITRYISAAEIEETINHKSLLYGEDYAGETIIIQEGCLDVWKTGVGAVATFGTGFSKAQILKMINYPNRYICYDNEPLAQKRAKKLSSILSMYPGKTFNIQLDSKDAGEAPIKEIQKLRKICGLD